MSALTTPSQIERYLARARRSALSLEVKGLRRHGQSAYMICKQAYGFKGNRLSVLQQMDAMIANMTDTTYPELNADGVGRSV